MEWRELEKLATEYRAVYPEPSPLDVTDVVVRIEGALSRLRYIQPIRSRKTGQDSPMFDVQGTFRTSMRPMDLAREDIEQSLEQAFAGAKSFKTSVKSSPEGFEVLVLALARPESPVNGRVIVRAA